LLRESTTRVEICLKGASLYTCLSALDQLDQYAKGLIAMSQSRGSHSFGVK